MQTRDELAVAYHAIRHFHDQGTWRPGPPRRITLRLTSIDGPKEVGLPALENFINYTRSELGICFDLLGGGAGCFELILGAENGSPQNIEQAIEQDVHFQCLLNELNLHLIRLHMPSGTRSYAAHVLIKAGLITNRSANPLATSLDPLDAFGADLAEQLSYGIVDFEVLNFARGQARSSFAHRIWRKITLGLDDIRNKRFSVTVSHLEIVNEQSFVALVKQITEKTILLSIHGFANSFPVALESFSRFIYNTGLDRLSHFPILFSWPASSNPVTYLPQTRMALNSRNALLRTFEILTQAAASRPVNAIAHSHGNDVLVAVARDRANAGTLPRIHHAIFVEPDVDEHYLSTELELVSRAMDHMTIYYSNNDLALALSGVLFHARRAGVNGVAIDGALLANSTIDVIDVSGVAKGLTKHAPHVDAAEVVYDIRDALEDHPAKSRALYPGAKERLWHIRQLR